ncbi:hypothetical protein MCEMSEM18_03488 [Comamonadaceae bacterium]
MMTTKALMRCGAALGAGLACSFALALTAGDTPSTSSAPTTAPRTAKPAYQSAATSAAGTGASLQVRPGVVTDIQTFTPEGKNANAAQVVGGLLGGLAGVWLTKDSDWGTKTIAGTAGAAAGSQVGKVLAKGDQRLRVTVRLDDGTVATVEQDIEGEQFYVSQRVNIVGDNANGKVRAAP